MADYKKKRKEKSKELSFNEKSRIGLSFRGILAVHSLLGWGGRWRDPPVLPVLEKVFANKGHGPQATSLLPQLLAKHLGPNLELLVRGDSV